MKNKKIYYFGLLAALLFGFGITTMPALGNSLPVCVGASGDSNVQVKLGGRAINPALLLEAKGSQDCSNSETTMKLVEHSRTITVSPKGNALQNGAALLQAVSNIQPNASDRWLIKLEGGYYDLGGQTLYLNSFVDLEGSGERATFITSNIPASSIVPTRGVINGATGSNLRFLGVINAAMDAGSKTSVFVPSGVNYFQMFKVLISTPNSGQYNYGIFNAGNYTRISEMNITVGAADHNIGIYNTGGIELTDSVIHINGNVSNDTINWAFNNSGEGSAIINNSQLDTHEGGQTVGVRNNSGKDVTVLNSFIDARGGSTRNVGLEAYDATVIAGNSTIKAYNTNSYGLFSSNGGAIRVANSQVGFNTGSVFGSAQCVFAANINNYTALNNNCQSS